MPLIATPLMMMAMLLLFSLISRLTPAVDDADDYFRRFIYFMAADKISFPPLMGRFAAGRFFAAAMPCHFTILSASLYADAV